MNDHNCRNCGAPLNKFGDCEYCGTKAQSGVRTDTRKSVVEITSTGISFYVQEAEDKYERTR